MASFRNILVGVDLCRCEHLEATGLGPVAEGAIRQATWAAREHNARLTFLAALNKADPAGPPPGTDSPARPGRGFADVSGEVLADLVRRARGQGVEAQAVLAPGKAWVEIIHQARRDGHDLVVVGARDEGGLRHALFGGTTQKLLHDCPCPVWVVRRGAAAPPRNILVASNFDPPAQEALRLALQLGRRPATTVHLLHVVEYPLDYHWSSGLPDPQTENYHRQVRTHAERELYAQLKRSGAAGGEGVQVSVADRHGTPDDAILQFIGDHAVDLLALGTVARHGLSGVLLGNTAERLLPRVGCSVLVARSPAFPGPPAPE
jgi:universal stress protein E